MHSRVREYMIAFLVLETMMVGAFAATDFLVFYMFFEGLLIPMYIIIGVWGGPRRVYASFKFFLYTLAGSVLMLLALLAMWFQAGTTDIATLMHTPFSNTMQTWLFVAFLASFAVKVPMWPVHTWLPDAHVEAPTAGSVILAGVLLKMGGYGFLRFSVPMLPHASQQFAPLMFALGVIAVIYTSLVAIAQTDMKKLIAYSSVAHMGLVVIGTFTFNIQGIEGAMLQMLSHGIVSAALFLCVGVVYDRMHTREIARYGGLGDRMPGYALDLPVLHHGQHGPARHVRLRRRVHGAGGRLQGQLLGVAARQHGMILGAAYALWLYRRIIFGAITRDDLRSILDLSPREVAIFAPLVVLTLWMGVYPSSFTQFFDASVRRHGGPAPVALMAPTTSWPGLDAMTDQNWTLALPEIVLACCAMAILVFGVLWKRGNPSLACSMLGLGALMLAAVLAMSAPLGVGYSGLFSVDRFAVFTKLLILAGAGLSLVLAIDYNVQTGIDRFEFPVLILLCTVGMMTMASAANLMSLYIGLELQSLSIYVMAAFNRDDVRSSEAGLKYFVLGALASGLLLYGISLTYGFSGSMDFAQIRTAFTGESPAAGLVVGVVFIVAGLAFKISAVPFHMWTPDVYEGAPTAVTAFMSTAPKVAAIALLLRSLEVPFGHLGPEWQQLVVLVSIASMLLGSLAAIGQTSIKRLMAYSSIGHMGYALIGLATNTPGRHPGRADLHGHLRVHVGGRVRLRHRHAPARAAAGQDRRPVGPGPDRPDAGAGLRGVHVLHGRHPAVQRLLRQAVRVLRGGAGGLLDARGHRRADLGRRGVLLPADRQGDVFRRRGAGIRRAGAVAVVRGRRRRAGDDAVLRLSRPDRRRRPGCGGRAVRVSRSEKRKMLAGELYDPADAEIQADQAATKRWLVRYNAALRGSAGRAACAAGRAAGGGG